MTYRIIDVDNKTYEYVIGPTYIKIKHVGLFSTEENKQWFDHSPQCSCGPEYNCYAGDGPSGYAVTPGVIKHLIRTKERIIQVLR